MVHAVAMLTASAQLAGSGQLVKPAFSGRRAAEWQEGLQSRLCGLPRRTGVSASEVVLSNRHLAAAIACKLLDAAPHVQALPATALTRSEVESLLRNLLEALHRLVATSMASNRRFPRVATDKVPQRTPHTLMQAAYAVLNGNKPLRHPVQGDVDALIVFGLAGSALWDIRGCELCFRLALPGHARCEEHSLSKEAGGDRLERQARYQSGRRASSDYQSRVGELPVHFNAIASLKQHSLLIAGLLWGGLVPDERRITSAILKLIDRYPHVRMALGRGGDAQPHQLFDLLRQSLDPLEFVPGNWRAKLRAAEAWLSAVESSTPGARRAGKKCRDAQHLALALVRGVDLSKSQLATALKVHPSTLSKWFSRNRDDPVVAEVVERLAQSAPRVLERETARKKLKARVASRGKSPASCR